MGRRGPAWSAYLLIGAVLAGCGPDEAGPQDRLDVSLDGFVAVAERPTPEVLCAPDPAAPATAPPGLPVELGATDAVQLQSVPTTLEAYAWTATDADAARALVAEATGAAAGCVWTHDVDLDGDGVAEVPAAEVQQVEEWSAGDWTGVRIVRTVTGVEQVDSRLVADGDVVLLVVTRADGDDPALLAVADDYLAAVAERLG